MLLLADTNEGRYSVCGQSIPRGSKKILHYVPFSTFYGINIYKNLTAACILDTECDTQEVCQGGQCINPCVLPQTCGMNAKCHIANHLRTCSCPAGFTGNADVECVRSK